MSSLQMNPQQNLQQYYENLIQKQSQPQNKSKDAAQQLLANFKKINKTIQHRLQYYCKLTDVYMQKVQNNFLISFSKVLQKMGNDLMLAQEAYKNIDKQIMMKERCVNLNQDKIFFLKQSTFYKQQYEFKLKQSDKLKEKNYLLIKQNTGLKEKLFEKIQQNMFLKQRLKRFQKLNLNNQQDLNNAISHELQIPSSPAQNIKNLNQTYRMDKNERKWASVGKQTEQQKKRKRQQLQKQKKILFVDIKKQLKNRQQINLEAILDRNKVEQPRNEINHQFRSRKKKNIDDLMKNGSFTVRLADIVNNQNDLKNKSGYESTVVSNLQSGGNSYLSARRNLHTSGQRQIRNIK